ncbi:MAG: sigma-54-dependent Fis family transcriptional regulator [Epsilonproteobacteria bacterium]|nr:sigma-54-dependent Fis family transcriptional regulator [Campylobacterota bacterium]
MKVAIVEDDINMRKSLSLALKANGFDVVEYRNAVDALKKLDESVDIIVSDITMPKMDGIEFVKELNGKYDVILITGNATLTKAIEALRLGVKDFLTKPFEIEDLIAAINRKAKLKKVTKGKKVNLKPEFIAVDENTLKALEMAKKVAKTNANVMLLGESGVGKEEFAKFIHQNSGRSGEFIALNMSALPENLIESELFGYEKGAFTDAVKDKPGMFELADKGTLFLDEIGEMPFNLQAKLLRVLQEREFFRLGGTKPKKLDVRIISATNQDVKEMIKENKFREDLFYRLNTFPIYIPPLRERKKDILPIANSVLERVVKEYGLEEKHFSKEAQEVLLNYDYPGNIRELINIVERAAILSDGSEIKKDDIYF